MAKTYKILGQASPSATTETDLYTVPSATQAVVSSIVVANRNIADSTFRISVSEDGNSTSNKDYIAYDISIPGNSQYSATLGITLNAADKIRVYSSTSNLSFNVFGSEIA
jgi:hypothetical protein